MKARLGHSSVIRIDYWRNAAIALRPPDASVGATTGRFTRSACGATAQGIGRRPSLPLPPSGCQAEEGGKPLKGPSRSFAVRFRKEWVLCALCRLFILNETEAKSEAAGGAHLSAERARQVGDGGPLLDGYWLGMQ